jgi:hypothetical protein
MDEQRKMDAAAQRFAELKHALDRTPLWGQVTGEAAAAPARVAQALAEVIDDLSFLCTRDDGWLRITNRDSGARVYFKFKFTSTKWPNHYIYYEVDGPQMGEGLDGLRRKYEQVQDGKRKPTKDHAYDHPEK